MLLFMFCFFLLLRVVKNHRSGEFLLLVKDILAVIILNDITSFH